MTPAVKTSAANFEKTTRSTSSTVLDMGKEKKLQEVSGPVSVLPLIRGVFNLKPEIFDEILKKTHKRTALGRLLQLFRVDTLTKNINNPTKSETFNNSSIECLRQRKTRP